MPHKNSSRKLHTSPYMLNKIKICIVKNKQICRNLHKISHFTSFTLQRSPQYTPPVYKGIFHSFPKTIVSTMSAIFLVALTQSNYATDQLPHRITMNGGVLIMVHRPWSLPCNYLRQDQGHYKAKALFKVPKSRPRLTAGYSPCAASPALVVLKSSPIFCIDVSKLFIILGEG